MGNEEMIELYRSILNKHNAETEKENRNYNETIQNVKTVLSYDVESESPLLERRDGERVAFTTKQDDLQITVAIDEPLQSLLIEMDPLIPCSDVEANYFMSYSVLNAPLYGGVAFNAEFKRLTLKAEVSFNEDAVSESSLFQILDTLRKEVTQVREHISEVRSKITSCVLDDYDDLIFTFERESDSSKECEFMREAADTIDSTFNSLECVYYGPSSSQEESFQPVWQAYLNRPGCKYLSKIRIHPEGFMRVAVYFASPVKGHYFRQAARYCCNWARKLKTGHVTFDRNYGFGIYIDQYLHTSLSEKTLRSILRRCLQGLEEIGESLHNNANGILNCSFEPEDDIFTIEDLAAFRHLLSRIVEKEEGHDSGDSDQLLPGMIPTL